MRLRKKDIANAEREIANLKDRISGAQAEVLILTDVKNKTTNMTETIDAAITALQNISNQWYTVGAKYNNLLQNVKRNYSRRVYVYKKKIYIQRKIAGKM